METRDVRVAKRIQRWTGGPTLFWRFMAGQAMWAFIAAMFFFGAIMPLEEALVTMFFPAALGSLATASTQFVVRRTRPTITRTDYRQWLLKYSFPSAHASGAFCFAVLLTAAVLRVAPEVAIVFIPAAFILALGIALSRVVVGVHYPTDVLAGAIFGSAIGIVFVTL